MANKPRVLIPWEESEQAARALVSHLNTWVNWPLGVRDVDYEHLPNDSVGMCVSSIQGAYKTRQYIGGGYMAQYQFKVIYRAQPSDNDDRLAATEFLNRFAAWAEQNPQKPDMGERAVVRSIKRDSDAALFATYEDGSADFQILMTMTWEVM
jgi:hypothetical protein